MPSKNDEEIKEFIRMYEDHKIALKKIKQQIIGLLMRYGYKYPANKNTWTEVFMKWIKSISFDNLMQEVLNEYLLTYDQLTNRIKHLENRIKELGNSEEYKDRVNKLRCFIGIETHTALALISEVSDFNRFKKTENFSSFLGLTPGEYSSGESNNKTATTKMGNSHLRRLLTEASQCYTRGQIGIITRKLKNKQKDCTEEIKHYANKANERLRRKYYHLVLKNNLPHNKAKMAVARELSCFV